ncbi:MAG: GTPase HflX [Candidatus Hydrothermarchaeales archaeon]
MKAAVVMLFGEEADERLSEIKSLCKTAGYDVADIFTQKGGASRRYLIRKGKVREIKDFIRANEIQLVVFENFLTSGQVLALEDELKVPVIDRFDLILNVFELHAASKEAKLQIELARLKRKMPYIKMYLSRKVKTEHPGFGGSGEFIIHSTITTIHKRIKSIEESLERFENRTALQRGRRKKVGKVVSLAGYTNVGKTSLLYALTGVKKPVKDELFTTLRTKTASLTYNGSKFLINDTIGFIRNLPYQLIYAFNATLMDIASSDLILIIHDSSLEPEELLRRKEICEDILTNIGADKAKWLDVENKIDLGKRVLDDAIGVSAVTGEGLEGLKQKIHRLLTG